MVEILLVPKLPSKWENSPDSDDGNLEGEILESEACDTAYLESQLATPYWAKELNGIVRDLGLPKGKSWNSVFLFSTENSFYYCNTISERNWNNLLTKGMMTVHRFFKIIWKYGKTLQSVRYEQHKLMLYWHLKVAVSLFGLPSEIHKILFFPLFIEQQIYSKVPWYEILTPKEWIHFRGN